MKSTNWRRKKHDKFAMPSTQRAGPGRSWLILYKIDLPADDGGIIKKCLEALALRFDDERAKVDQSVFNPARIWKLYGTFNRKGDSLPERPHRLARILELP
jgi:hypothetical protein